MASADGCLSELSVPVSEHRAWATAMNNLGILPVGLRGPPLLSDLPPPSMRERPPGCKTVFVGGLPENATEEVIREVFDQCGEILALRKSTDVEPYMSPQVEMFEPYMSPQVQMFEPYMTPQVQMFEPYISPQVQMFEPYMSPQVEMFEPYISPHGTDVKPYISPQVQMFEPYMSPQVQMFEPYISPQVQMFEPYISPHGYRMRIGSSTEKKDSGRIHVDFAQARDDLYEWECQQRLLAREQRHLRFVHEDRLLPPSPPPIVHFSEHEAAMLAERLK
ncbi:Ecto-NOX disulfide-thiol exchanger 1, partial [Dissostichus eleginoides]